MGSCSVVAAMAAKKGWAIVEDSCHALGGRYRHADGSDGRVGDCRYADMAVFSFHPTKTISSGEGGMIACRDAAMRDQQRRRLLRPELPERGDRRRRAARSAWGERLRIGFETGLIDRVELDAAWGREAAP